MDYRVLLSSFERLHEVGTWPRQRVIHACLRDAIISGSLASGSRLLASRALADELSIARNTVVYAYEQLATEGLTLAGPRGTLVAPLSPSKTAARASPGAPVSATIARRMRGLRALPAADAEAVGFAPGVPALAAFPLPVWRRALDRAWRAIGSGDLNYGDVAGVLALREESALI